MTLHRPTLPEIETVAPGVARPPRLLWAIGCLAVAVAICLIGGFLVDHYPFGFDRAILLWFRDPADLARAAGPDWVRRAMVDFTALGGGTVLTTWVVLTLGLLAVRRLWLTAGLVLAATLLGSILSGQAKLLFARPRPDLVEHLVEARGLSFPSGHATNSAIIYLTLALLISQVVPGRATRASGTVADIHERKRAQAALLETELRYHALVDLSPDGVIVTSDGLVEYANAAAARILGLPGPQALVGMNGEELMRSAQRELESTSAELRAGGRAVVLTLFRDVSESRSAARAS